MTKYVLAGGRDRHYPNFGKRLADLIHRDVAAPDILSCFFAQPPEKRTEKQAAWAPWFEENFSFAKTITYAREGDFFEQVQKCDVIYIHGGQPQRLLETLADTKRVEKTFAGKIIIGSSAGADYLARSYYSPARDAAQKGSGILALGVVVHYGASSFGATHYPPSRWENATKKVEAQLNGEPLILLPEGIFTVIEQ
jgi:hypothetical protein